MSEPRATLHTRKWSEARRRVHQVDAGTSPVFVALLDHVERGWQAFRPLRQWLEQTREHAGSGGDDYAHLLNFVDGELSDVFLLIGVGVADLVPGWPGWEAEADPGDVTGWTDALRGSLAVFRLACTTADVPEPFRTLGLSVVRTLEAGGWCEELSALLGAAGELVPDGRD